MIARLVYALFVLMLVHVSAIASDSMMVMNAVVQPPLVASNKVGALYFMLMNHGAGDDKLIGIESAVADKVVLHESSEENGIAKMRPVEALAIPAGGMVELKPGGLHAMLTGIKEPLAKGARVMFTLRFEAAGDVAVEAVVGDLASVHSHGTVDGQQ